MTTFTRVFGDYNIVSVDPGVDNVNVTTNSLNLNGNLNVSGNITYITVENFTVDDPFLTVAGNNSGSLGTAPYQHQGIVAKTSASTYAGLRFDNGTQKWQAGTNVSANGAPITAYSPIATFSQGTVPVYTAAVAANTAGSVGSMIAVSDSPTVGGRIAFWDTTNVRWSYVSDNTAV